MTMRLEDTDDAAFVTLARAVQRRLQLRRIVRVIVHHDDVICLTKHLKPAMHPLERFKTLPNLLKRDVQFKSNGDCRQRIRDVMTARHFEMHFA